MELCISVNSAVLLSSIGGPPGLASFQGLAGTVAVLTDQCLGHFGC